MTTRGREGLPRSFFLRVGIRENDCLHQDLLDSGGIEKRFYYPVLCMQKVRGREKGEEREIRLFLSLSNYLFL